MGPWTVPFFPLHVASGRCFLTAAAAGAPAGVVSAFAEPSGWCAGTVLDVAGWREGTPPPFNTPPPQHAPPPLHPHELRGVGGPLASLFSLKITIVLTRMIIMMILMIMAMIRIMMSIL